MRGVCCALLAGYVNSVGDMSSVFVDHFVLLCQRAVVWLAGLSTRRKMQRLKTSYLV